MIDFFSRFPIKSIFFSILKLYFFLFFSRGVGGALHGRFRSEEEVHYIITYFLVHITYYILHLLYLISHETSHIQQQSTLRSLQLYCNVSHRKKNIIETIDLKTKVIQNTQHKNIQHANAQQ